MFKKLLQTNDDTAMLVLRLIPRPGILSTGPAKRSSAGSAAPGFFGRHGYVTSRGGPVSGQHLLFLRLDGGIALERLPLLAGLFTRIAALASGEHVCVLPLYLEQPRKEWLYIYEVDGLLKRVRRIEIHRARCRQSVLPDHKGRRQMVRLTVSWNETQMSGMHVTILPNDFAGYTWKQEGTFFHGEPFKQKKTFEA